MSDTNIDTYEVEEQDSRIPDHDVIVLEQEPETGGELVKFGILVVVLLATVLIIALLRPLIFNKIVPAVLGEGQLVAPLVSDEVEAETIKPVTEEVEAVEPTEAGTEATEESVEAVAEPVNPEDFPTAVPSQTHTVQAGENLTTIARQYGVSVQAIVAANEITNPDRVTVGTVLIIPEGE